MGKLIDRTGEIHDSLQITKELGGGRLIAQCLNCGYANEYVKKAVVNQTAACDECTATANTTDSTNEINGGIADCKRAG